MPDLADTFPKRGDLRPIEENSDEEDFDDPADPIPADPVDPADPALVFHPPPAMARAERATHSIGVDTFKTGVDDFNEWIDLFEKAVKLATNVRDEDSLHFLYKEWLPLKLDKEARALLIQASAVNWPALKVELKGLLVDPQEKYKWLAKKTTIKWNGKESFHALASKIKAAIDRYEKDMPNEYKEREHFFRFRLALPKDYRDAIDMGCGETDRTIKKAVEMAQRTQMTQSDDTEAKSVDFAGASFAGAALEENRTSSVELALAGITTQLENLTVSIRNVDTRIRAQDDRLRSLEKSAPYGSGNYRDDNRSRGYSPSRGQYGQNFQQYSSGASYPSYPPKPGYSPARNQQPSYSPNRDRRNFSPSRNQRSGFSPNQNQRSGYSPNRGYVNSPRPNQPYNSPSRGQNTQQRYSPRRDGIRPLNHPPPNNYRPNNYPQNNYPPNYYPPNNYPPSNYPPPSYYPAPNYPPTNYRPPSNAPPSNYRPSNNYQHVTYDERVNHEEKKDGSAYKAIQTDDEYSGEEYAAPPKSGSGRSSAGN